MATLAGKKGFTLIELLIATIVLFVGLGLAIAAVSSMYDSNELAYQTVTATQDAHRVIEQMRQQSTVGTFPSNVTTQFPSGQAILGFSSLSGETVIPTYVDPNANPLNVTITVTWNSVTKGGNSRVVTRQLTTLVTRR